MYVKNCLVFNIKTEEVANLSILYIALYLYCLDSTNEKEWLS